MPTHAVEDIDRWLQGKAGRAAAIESETGSNVTDYVAADGSNNVAIRRTSPTLQPCRECWHHRRLRYWPPCKSIESFNRSLLTSSGR